MKFYIGIDGGGSSTKAAIIDERLQVIGRGESGASNHYAVGMQQAAANCRLAAEAALLDAQKIEPGLRLAQIESWGFGLAGVRRSADAVLMRVQLNAIVEGKPFVLDHDAAAAQSGAFSGAAGIVLSVGTGAICFATDEQGERYFADGWGPLLGDEGSGYWIGQEALRAVCRAEDGRAPSTRLSAAALQTLPVEDMDALVRFVYSPNVQRDQIASLARDVFVAAKAGDKVAAEIHERAVAHLGNTVVAVTRAMLTQLRQRAGLQQPEPQEIAVALRGGLCEDEFFRAAVSYEIVERLVELKREYWPISAWRIAKPQHDAAVGAALLAQRSEF